MESSNVDRKRQDKTILAHKMLLKLDRKDIAGSVTFYYKKGQGITQYKIEEHGTLQC